MIYVSQLVIYPIKSLRGIAVNRAVLDRTGFQYDRRFMLVTADGHCLTQHRCPQMALLQVAMQNGELQVWHRDQPDDRLVLPLVVSSPECSVMQVSVWDSHAIEAVRVSDQADFWFSRILHEVCQLVYMPDHTHRAVDQTYARHQESVSFADGYPYLLIGQASLDALNQRLVEPVSMQRFRPNIVVSGAEPYAEESWEHFRIGGFTFYRGESCGRCILTTLDPDTGQKGPEPLRTLSTYRQQDHKIVFGQYVLAVHNPARAVAGSSTVNDPNEIRIGQLVEEIRHEQPAALAIL
ncbi:MOSC domain-containing protein [Spirosoma linguale]|uniref:MOSC domain containing protein n=1 Tax=Spirosoma linguale (strain ATCC 33905 / DSM 74 / LMG 10896 / Claus 1) TaxID=504472 RepID=D2QJS4_SPILD|nr:MOSC domain containing protein [Spirosoma linguale DSM 74]